MVGDDNGTALVGNLKKARKSWVRLTRILGREGGKPMVSGMFFNVVVHAVLLFGVRDMSPDPLHRKVPGKFSTQGRVVDHMETVEETGGVDLVISAAGNSYGGGGL